MSDVNGTRRDSGFRRSTNGWRSAQREHERRRARREIDATSRHPRIGRLILAVTTDPQSTKAWVRGAQGERRLGVQLDKLATDGAVVLHDRRIPNSRANIDHIVIAHSGMWVIDANHYHRGR